MKSLKALKSNVPKQDELDTLPVMISSYMPE